MKYGRENKISNEDYLKLCIQVADQLGFKVIKNYSTSCVIGKGNKEICLYVWYGAPDRIKITGNYPRNIKNEYYPPENPVNITVSLNKSPEKIANDIKSRFLPVYEAQLQECFVRVNKSNDYYNRQRKLLEDASKIANATLLDWGIQNNKFNFYIKDQSGHIKDQLGLHSVVVNNHLDVTLNGLTLEQFKYIVDYLKNGK